MRASFQSVIESALRAAQSASSEAEAAEILTAIEHPEMSAVRLARAAKALFPDLFEQLSVDDEDTDLQELMSTIAFSLYENVPCDEQGALLDEEEEEEEEESSSDEEYEPEEKEEEVPTTRKRKDMEEPHDFRSSIRNLMPIYQHLDAESKPILLKLLELNKQGAKLVDMRPHMLALQAVSSSLPPQDQALLEKVK